MFFNKISRFSVLIFMLCFTYFWLIDKGYFNNHYYFMSLICFLLFITEKKASFSENVNIPKISIFTLQVMVFIVYFIAGINKINPYWLFDLQPIQHILEVKSEMTNNMFFKKPILVKSLAYTGLIFDLSVGFLLFYHRTRLFAFIMILLFHLTNYWVFKDVGEIGLFPFFMISTIILFIDPHYLNKLFKLNNKPPNKINNSLFLNKFIVCFLLIQLLIPFRHVFFKGNVDYNGIGQRFSWRMKIMYKDSSFQYFITDNSSGKKYAVDATKMLTNKQYNNLLYYPDLIVPLAKKIQLEASENFGIKSAKITCEYKTKFMGKNEQLLFSPELDLTKIKDGFLNQDWLYDLKK